jgi:hypothetical protein
MLLYEHPNLMMMAKHMIFMAKQYNTHMGDTRKEKEKIAYIQIQNIKMKII